MSAKGMDRMMFRYMNNLGWATLITAVLTMVVKVGVGEAQPPPPEDRPRAESEEPRRREPMAGPRRMRDDRRGMQRREGAETPRGPRDEPRAWEEPPPLSDEMIDWVLERIQTRLPRLHERLTRLRSENPQRFERVFHNLMPFFKEYRHLQEHNPALAETILQEFAAEERLRELSREYAAAKEDPAREAAMAQEMDQLVRQQFELRHQRFEARLKDFEERIREQQLHLQMMRERLTSMRGKVEELVKMRVTQVKEGRMGEGFPRFGGEMGGPGMHGPGRPGMGRPDGLPGEPPPDGMPPEGARPRRGPGRHPPPPPLPDEEY